MKERWIKLAARIDALTLRERILVFAASAAAIFFLMHFFALGPQLRMQDALNAQISQQNNNIEGIDNEIRARVEAAQQDPDAPARERLAAVTAEFAPRQKDPLLAAEVQEAERQLGALREVSGVLQRGELGNTRGYAEYFRALARQHADGLWLTGLSINGAGSEIGVRGRALDPAAVPGYLTRLTREPILQGKGFGSLSISEGAREAAAGTQPATQPAPFVEFSLQSNSEAPRP